MLRNLKKMLILIPCMILGLFLLSNSKAFALEWGVVGAESVVIGEGTGNETTYYFTDDTSWEFKTELLGDKWYNKYNNYGKYGFLTYVIIRPDGSATKESEKINFVNTKGSFSINDITTKEYVDTVDVDSRASVVPAGTYYVDIRYYKVYLDYFTLWQQDGVDTVRIVVGDGTKPEANVTFNDTTNQFTIEASALKDGKGHSLIKSVSYYFSETDIQNEVKTFLTNMEASSDYDTLSFKNSTVKINIDKPSGNYNYLYVMVITYNGEPKIVTFDMNEEKLDAGVGSGSNQSATNNSNNNDGLWDFEFGELILLVLVVVLIVSCVLIITQKIVDYKKRLY